MHNLAESTNAMSVNTIEFVGEEDEDDIERKYFAKPKDCITTICLIHKHESLSFGVYAEKCKVVLNDFVPNERNRKKQK